MFIRPPFVQAPSACWAPGSKSRTDVGHGERQGEGSFCAPGGGAESVMVERSRRRRPGTSGKTASEACGAARRLVGTPGGTRPRRRGPGAEGAGDGGEVRGR